MTDYVWDFYYNLFWLYLYGYFVTFISFVISTIFNECEIIDKDKLSLNNIIMNLMYATIASFTWILVIPFLIYMDIQGD